MFFSMDVRRARKGDCLLLHYGTEDDPGLILIDGGPKAVYNPHLKPRLEEIRAARNLKKADSLPVDLLMVSHIDDDHIQGILDLTKQEIERADAGQPFLLSVLDFWHNSFDELVGKPPTELTASIEARFGQASLAEGAFSDAGIREIESESSEGAETIRSGLAVLASVAQGFRLRQDAIKLDYPLNADFGGKLVLAAEGNAPIDFSRGLSLQVAGPMKPELLKLQEDHIAWLKSLAKAGKAPPAALAEYLDTSVPNLSSLVVLAEAMGKRILLTGDARGDKILEGLELVGLIEADGTLEVDVLKVPHHGSDRNLETGFFERIIAQHYVFSGNGEHGNPERETLEMLFEARGDNPFTIHLTYPLEEIDAERKKDWEKEQNKEIAKKAKKPDTEVRTNWSPKENGLVAFFGGITFAPGQELRIVDESTPHVIDLLDPLGF